MKNCFGEEGKNAQEGGETAVRTVCTYVYENRMTDSSRGRYFSLRSLSLACFFTAQPCCDIRSWPEYSKYLPTFNSCAGTSYWNTTHSSLSSCRVYAWSEARVCGWCFAIISHLVDPRFFSASYRPHYDSLRTISIDDGGRPQSVRDSPAAAFWPGQIIRKKRDSFRRYTASLSIAPARRKNAIEVETEHKVLIFTSTKLYVVLILWRRGKSSLPACFVSAAVRSATRARAFREVEKMR